MSTHPNDFLPTLPTERLQPLMPQPRSRFSRSHSPFPPFPLSSFLPFILSALLVLLTSGCGGEEVAQTEPLSGWEAAEDKWWQADFDTTGAFPDLETLESIGAEGEMTLAANAQIAQQSGVATQQLARSVKQGLIELYRNDPEVVDSLFEKYVRPKLEGITISGDRAALVEKHKREGYNLITKHFREPRTTLKLGEDITIDYPDSLSSEGVSGTVRTQVRLNEAGEPQAIELIESVHPVLDAITLRATSEMRWQPAYILRGNDWEAVPAWARFNISFQPPS